MDSFVEAVYLTLNGQLSKEHAVDGVEDLFAEGGNCDSLYGQVYEAQRRLEQRLGVAEYDKDVETIICAMEEIQKELCLKMYEYGAKFSQKKSTTR